MDKGNIMLKCMVCGKSFKKRNSGFITDRWCKNCNESFNRLQNKFAGSAQQDLMETLIAEWGTKRAAKQLNKPICKGWGLHTISK